MAPLPQSDGPGAPGWGAVAAVVALAALMRALFYPGFFGSDEVTYIESAYRLLDGNWSVPQYVGANRYGVNLPVALFSGLLGRHEFSAALYSLLCSLAEVALVTRLGARLVGVKGAVVAGLLLATLPVHVHYAGRLMADAPFALFATASFLLLAEAEARRSARLWFAAGCAAGFTFWIKPAAVVYIGVLAAYPLLARRIEWRWGWVVAGFAAVVLANNLFFMALTGRFWFMLETMGARRSSGYLAAELGTGALHDHAAFYLEYLFGKAYHTWLLGPLALAAVLWAWHRHDQWPADRRQGLAFVAFWGGGLLLLLSLLVVSVRPLTLIPKQINYMLMFVAPLCLLAGWLLSTLRAPARAAVLVLWLVPATLLAGLLQASTLVFTANSKATVAYMRAHPGQVAHLGSNAYRAAQFEQVVRPGPDRLRFKTISEALVPAEAPGDQVERYAVVDLQTILWGADEPFRRIEQTPACWQRVRTLEPVVRGAGPALARGLADLMSAASLPGGLVQRTAALAVPLKAYVYRVPAQGCP